jgi:hypothetical protein
MRFPAINDTVGSLLRRIIGVQYDPYRRAHHTAHLTFSGHLDPHYSRLVELHHRDLSDRRGRYWPQ